MFKFPHEDLRDALRASRSTSSTSGARSSTHVAEQLALGHLVTIDVDAWFLPDTRGDHVPRRAPEDDDRRADDRSRRAPARLLPQRRRTTSSTATTSTACSASGSPRARRRAAAVRRDDSLRRWSRPRRGRAAPSTVVALAARAPRSRAPTTNPLVRMRKQIQSDMSWLGPAATCAVPPLRVRHVPPVRRERRARGRVRRMARRARRRWPRRRDRGSAATLATGCKALEFGLARVVRGRTVDLDGTVRGHGGPVGLQR